MASTKNFKSLDALQSVVNVVNEAGEAVKDKSRTIANSAIPDVLAGHWVQESEVLLRLPRCMDWVLLD